MNAVVQLSNGEATPRPGWLDSRIASVRKRGLMGYPENTAEDDLRIEGIAQLMRCCRDIVVTVPVANIDVVFDADLPPELLYYLICSDYEVHDIEFALRYVRLGDRVMELGAGIGVTGCVLGKASRERVVIVEANPDLHQRIRRNFWRNGLACEIVGAAAVPASFVGDQIRFGVAANYWWSALTTAEPARQITVPARRLDELLAQYEPTVLAIDIEGAEVDLLLGSQLPQFVRLVLLEIHSPTLGMECTCRVVATLQSQGFVVVNQGAHSWVLQRETPETGAP